MILSIVRIYHLLLLHKYLLQVVVPILVDSDGLTTSYIYLHFRLFLRNESTDDFNTHHTYDFYWHVFNHVIIILWFKRKQVRTWLMILTPIVH